MKTTLTRLGALTLAVALAGTAQADDLADEADLQFELGADAYRARDFRTALEHFLTSNRLVPNRNVVYNIARAYEQLTRYADAHRAYTTALEGETDAAAQSSIRAALARIAPYVAVMRVTTEPPGATIYIDRRDLGPRGSAPRAMAFQPGRYRVIAELEGYEPATSEPVELRVGQEAPVSLRLTRILGTVRVEGEVHAAVRVDDEAGPVVGTVPCTIELPPGRHRLHLSADGYQPFTDTVDVVARSTITTRPTVAQVTGAVLVSADERDALVEVDGRAVGFTPAVINVQVGQRRVRVSMPGFRPIERQITVRQSAQERVDVSLTRYEEVSAASRAAESVEDAPSSVSIVTSQELRAMAYPTIAEALRGIRGVYLSDDRSYESLGFRGFGRPGDYGNRVLVLLDGHPTNDNWVNSSYVGYDARVDLEDVERIEVVRGPGSLLYGTGAFSGVINIVTRGRDAPNGGEVGLSTNQYGVARARAGLRLRSGAFGMWASAAAAYGSGRDLFIPEYQQPAMGATPASDGYARNADGFVAATLSGRLWYRDLTLQWMFNTRDKTIPTGVYDTLPGSPRNAFVDARGLAELRYEPRFGDSFQLLTRAYLNYYRFVERLAYDANAPNDDGYDTYRGVWTGAEVRGVWTPGRALRLTVGGEGVAHVIVHQTAGTVAAPESDDASDHPYQTAAAYVSADGSPVDWLRYSAGARLDWYSTFGATVNPRVALIFRPYAAGNLKVMAGRAFRAPSIYEIFYTTATSRPNGSLQPETILSGEVEYSHRITNTWTALASVYANYIQNLIALRTTRIGMADFDQYQNTSAPVLTLGAEAELRREWRQGWMLSASYAFQRSRYVGTTDGLREVPNAPEHLFSLRGAAPVVPQLFIASTRLSVEGPRWDRNDREFAGAPAQTRTDPAVVWDVVLSGSAERWGLRYAVGVYNVTDWRYSVPVSSEFVREGMRPSITNIVQNGRTFLANASVTF